MKPWRRKLYKRLRWQTSARGLWDFQHFALYSRLRKDGWSHHDALAELERLWLQAHPHLDADGYERLA